MIDLRLLNDRLRSIVLDLEISMMCKKTNHNVTVRRVGLIESISRMTKIRVYDR